MSITKSNTAIMTPKVMMKPITPGVTELGSTSMAGISSSSIRTRLVRNLMVVIPRFFSRWITTLVLA